MMLVLIVLCPCFVVGLFLFLRFFFFLMIRRPPRSTRTDKLFPLHDALPIWWRKVLVDNIPESYSEMWRAFSSAAHRRRSEEHTSELQSLMRISYAVFCLKKKKSITKYN